MITPESATASGDLEDLAFGNHDGAEAAGAGAGAGAGVGAGANVAAVVPEPPPAPSPHSGTEPHLPSPQADSSPTKLSTGSQEYVLPA